MPEIRTLRTPTPPMRTNSVSPSPTKVTFPVEITQTGRAWPGMQEPVREADAAAGTASSTTAKMARVRARMRLNCQPCRAAEVPLAATLAPHEGQRDRPGLQPGIPHRRLHQLPARAVAAGRRVRGHLRRRRLHRRDSG